MDIFNPHITASHKKYLDTRIVLSSALLMGSSVWLAISANVAAKLLAWFKMLFFDSFFYVFFSVFVFWVLTQQSPPTRRGNWAASQGQAMYPCVASRHGAWPGFSLSNAYATMVLCGGEGACVAKGVAFFASGLICAFGILVYVASGLNLSWLSILWVAQFMRTLCVCPSRDLDPTDYSVDVM